jgi:predicted DNA-binding transcriptional regulator AlpA
VGTDPGHLKERPEVPDGPPLLLRAAQACRLCSVSEATWGRWDSAGKIPRGIKIGGARLWRRAELLDWVAAGCPPRREWEARRRT